MRLLILTQKVDMNDDVLGFMRGWIIEFAEKCEKVTVIALGVGEHKLPGNVKVLSLGKETGESIIKYLTNFYRYIWQEKNNYDTVLVHMNREYVLLGGVLWKLWQKKVYLWYNHAKGNFLSNISGCLADIIFYTSPFSYFSKNKKAKMMPVGINTDLFFKDDNIKKIDNSILCLGRISPVKKVDILIKAAKILKDRNIKFVINIIGSPTDDAYYSKLKKMVEDYGLSREISFRDGIANLKTPAEYNRHEMYINLTDSGSMDKTSYEAMACALPVILCNRSFEKIFPEEFLPKLMFEENDENDLAEKLSQALIIGDEFKIKYSAWAQKYVLENHSVKQLVKMIIKYFK